MFAVFAVLIGHCFAASPAERLIKKPDAWFRSDEGRATIENILSWQTVHGDWPKNMDTTDRKFSGKGDRPAGTFDNGATVGEMRLLAKAIRVTGDVRYRDAFHRGFDHILRAQYENGGWPQYFPLSKNYHRHITFNDSTMIRLMEFLEDVASDEEFKFLNADRRRAAKAAVARGIECILKCQVSVDGKLTVWCAQHDAKSLEPVLARSYEHPSLSGSESVGILRFLMDVENPSPEIVRSVSAGVAWFEAVQIKGFRYERSKKGPPLKADPNAPPLWARFYEITTNRPIFSDRDGIIKYDLQQVGSERRGGYTWYGKWGSSAIKEYSKWQHAK